MSIGIVIADAKTFQPLERQYYIIPEAAAIGGMYSYVLETPEAGTPIRPQPLGDHAENCCASAAV